MKLLFITQKLHEQDAFAVLWVEAFRRKGYDVTVLCLENRLKNPNFPVYSLLKEIGVPPALQILRFWWLIMTLRYNRVFIHMSPVWGGLGSWWWIVRRTPVYLWYTHYKMQWGLLLLGWYGKRLFCATKQSLPQYEASSKKIVTGHGIDTRVWKQRPNTTENPTELLVVHRLSRSKRLELNIRALLHLPEEYTMVVYGIPAEPDYVAELESLVEELGLLLRVSFMGTTPMDTLPDIYANHHLILNMASETIDKTMCEAMTCGCYPVTTKENARAIGLDSIMSSCAPTQDTPEEIASFVTSFRTVDPDALYRVVEQRHSLDGLIRQIDTYMMPGI